MTGDLPLNGIKGVLTKSVFGRHLAEAEMVAIQSAAWVVLTARSTSPSASTAPSAERISFTFADTGRRERYRAAFRQPQG